MKIVVKVYSANLIANSYENSEGMVLCVNKIFQANSAWEWFCEEKLL